MEEVDRSFCMDIANSMSWSAVLTLAQAGAAILGLIVQYKMWRRLKAHDQLHKHIFSDFRISSDAVLSFLGVAVFVGQQNPSRGNQTL